MKPYCKVLPIVQYKCNSMQLYALMFWCKS